MLEIDAASHTKVEEMRDMIIGTVSFAPARDRFKVFIIDEVHMLSEIPDQSMGDTVHVSGSFVKSSRPLYRNVINLLQWSMYLSC